MYLTVSKRFEFSASRRLYVESLSEADNVHLFGKEAMAKYGTGRNYIAWFVFSGSVDEETGMLINMSEIKAQVGSIINRSYDHRFLNKDNPAFSDIPPTPENLAIQLLAEVKSQFENEDSIPVVCHIQESDDRFATAYADGKVESGYSLSFSASRQTASPHLSDKENRELFGIASSPMGHGHYYRLHLTLKQPADRTSGMIIPNAEIAESLSSISKDYDHRNLNEEVADLKGEAITTENIARILCMRLKDSVSISRLRLYENPYFYADCHADGQQLLGLRRQFNAAHHLRLMNLSDEENSRLFGKCSNLAGHGHTYSVEASVGGELDRKSGTLYDMLELNDAIENSVASWQDRHLDLETDDFKTGLSTSENILRILFPRIDSKLSGRLQRLRLWETNNNRFTLRRNRLVQTMAEQELLRTRTDLL